MLLKTQKNHSKGGRRAFFASNKPGIYTSADGKRRRTQGRTKPDRANLQAIREFRENFELSSSHCLIRTVLMIYPISVQFVRDSLVFSRLSKLHRLVKLIHVAQ